MARIYSVLVVFALVLLVSNIGLGWWVGDWNGLVQEQQAVRQRVVKLKKSVSIEKYQLRALEQSSLSPQKLAEARQTLQRLEKELQQQQFALFKVKCCDIARKYLLIISAQLLKVSQSCQL